jgi:hypothetical protein
MYSVGIAFSPHSGNDAYSFLSLTLCTGVLSGLDYRTEPIYLSSDRCQFVAFEGISAENGAFTRIHYNAFFFTVLSEMHNLGGSLNNQK